MGSRRKKVVSQPTRNTVRPNAGDRIAVAEASGEKQATKEYPYASFDERTSEEDEKLYRNL